MPELAYNTRSDWRKQQISNKDDDHSSQSDLPRCPGGKVRFFEPGPKWEVKFGLVEAPIPVAEKRSPHHVLNEKIDEIYEELSELVSQRCDQHSPALESQIAQLTQKLRVLQNQEADLVRAYTKTKLSGPLAAGLAILEHADEILEKYGIVTGADAAAKDANPAKA